MYKYTNLYIYIYIYIYICIYQSAFVYTPLVALVLLLKCLKQNKALLVSDIPFN